MSNYDDYQAKLAAIIAIAKEEIKSPTMPVDVYLQEGSNLRRKGKSPAGRGQISAGEGNHAQGRRHSGASKGTTEWEVV